MRNLEIRGKIKDVDSLNDIKKRIEKLGGICKGHYSRTDIIFRDEREYGEGTKSLILYTENNRDSRSYSFIHKVSKWSGKYKKDRTILKKEFDGIKDAFNFINDEYGDRLESYYRYSREGWEYSLNNCDIFIEAIEILGPMIEIESDRVLDIERIIESLDIYDIEKVSWIKRSVSEIMEELIMENMENNTSE